MLLVETNLNTRIKILESQAGKPLKFRGVFAKLDHKTENGRIYSSKLWESVVNSKSVRERLEKRQILGELKHPEYRDIDIEKSAFIITDLFIEGGYVMGEAEVMPYPTLGGILEVFLRNGCQIGISSRGEGSIVEKSGESYVDDKDFELITFDTTLNPAVTEAVPQVMKESIKRGLNNLKTNSDISLLNRVISITEKSIHSSDEPMENIKQSNLSTGIKLGKILEKYKEKLAANVALIRENAELKSKINRVNTGVSEVKNINTKLLSKSEILLKRYQEAKDLLIQGNQLLENKTEQFNLFKKDYKFLESKYNSVTSKYQRSLSLVEGLVKNIENYENKLETSESTLERMRESLSELEDKDEEIRNLNEEIESVKETLEVKEHKIGTVNSKFEKQLQDLTEEIKSTKNKTRTLLKENADLKDQVSELTSLLQEARKMIIQSKRKLAQSQQQETRESALPEDRVEQRAEKREIRDGIHGSKIQPRRKEITNRTDETIGNNPGEDDLTFAVMNKLMS